MTVSFGSAQTNGLPLLLTTGITLAARQLLHTFPAGSATPERVKVFAQNLDVIPHTITVVLEDAGATLTRSFTAALPVGQATHTLDMPNSARSLRTSLLASWRPFRPPTASRSRLRAQASAPRRKSMRIR